MKIKRTIASALMGCFLFSSMVFVAPTLAEPTPINDTVKIEVVVDKNNMISAEKIQEKNDFLEIDITYPVISGLTDADFQEQLNYHIKKQVTYSKDIIEVQAKEYAQEAKQNGWEIRPYQLFIDYDLKKNDEAYLSFTITYYTYTGGANGMTVVSCINIDKKANEPIHLAALFPREADYKTKINHEILKQIELRSQDENEMFFEGDMGFQSISDTQGFYLKDNDLVIVFPKYEIAPGAMGTPEFTIELVRLKDSLVVKDEGKIVIEGLEIKTVINQETQVVMIPLRQVTEKLGYTITWDGADRSVELYKGARWTKVKVGENQYFFAKVAPFPLEAAPVIINDRTYVPVSFLERILQ
ncbi:MAG: DUF4163 domain-containing protein [Syntrophomonadaceae bacterium]|nr:DUF4163 domain-containing protein [Syntrophomonadaceae bacterium]